MQVTNWLQAFELALASHDTDGLQHLWVEHAHWRDVLGLHWDIDSLSGRVNVCAALLQRAKQAHPRTWSLAKGKLQDLSIIRADDGALIAVLTFETDTGPGEGVLRLVKDGHSLKAVSL